MARRAGSPDRLAAQRILEVEHGRLAEWGVGSARGSPLVVVTGSEGRPGAPARISLKGTKQAMARASGVSGLSTRTSRIGSRPTPNSRCRITSRRRIQPGLQEGIMRVRASSRILDPADGRISPT